MDALNLSIRAKDSRYPIPVYFDGADEPAFTLRFNPGDPFVLEYIEGLRGLSAPESGQVGEFLSFTDRIAHNLDAIFGDGAARLICRHDDVERALLGAILKKVEEGYADFKEQAAAAEKAARAQAVIDAKKNAAPYVAPGQ